MIAVQLTLWAQSNHWTYWLQGLWLPGVLATLGLLLLGWRASIYPTRRMVYLAIVPAVTSFLLVVPDLTWGARWVSSICITLLIVMNFLLLVATVADLWTLRRLPRLTVEREYQKSASLRQRQKMTVILANPERRTVRVMMRDGLPDAIEATPAEFEIELRGQSRAYLPYNLLSIRRGAFQWDAIHLCSDSQGGLWRRFWTLPSAAELNVYPDMKQLAEYELLARTNRLNLMGLRRTRQIGQDHDFERLRDYTRDDNHKHIDWRATARRNRLTVKDYQASQSQQVLFLIDCGRMMSNQAHGISLLDHALNSMLMLSYIALRRGDSVGLLCFSNRIHCFVPPRGGGGQMNRLLHASFDQFPEFVESRYDEAFLYLAGHCRRRALVILMTNLIDHVNASQVKRYLSSLVGRHLPLGVLLRDHQLFEPIEKVTDGDDEGLYRGAAAAGILSWRHQVLTDLQHQGVLSLDVFPEQITAPLINRYLDVKARGLL